MNILSINQLVFDGTEQDFYSFRVEVKCPKCFSNLSFLADEALLRNSRELNQKVAI